MKIGLGIIVLRHPIDSRRMAKLKERFAEKKERTSAVLLQSGLDEKWWAGSLDALLICDMSNTS